MSKIQNAIDEINDKVLNYVQAKQWTINHPYPSTEGIEVYQLEDCYNLIWSFLNQAE